MSKGILDEILGRLEEKPSQDRKRIAEEAYAEAAKEGLIWIPNPGPQTDAYLSKADVLLYGGQAGGGKRVCNDELVPVPLSTDPSGFRRHGDLQAGDSVYSPSGMPIPVIAAHPVVTDTDACEVEFDTGEKVVVDGDHLWHTWTEHDRDRILRAAPQWRAARRSSRKSRAVADSKKPWVSKAITEINKNRIHDVRRPTGDVRTTREIALSLLSKRGALNHSIEVAHPLFGLPIDLPIDPYLFGLWIGDGFSSMPRIGMLQSDWAQMAVPEPDKVVIRTKNRKQAFEERTYRWMRPALRALGVYGRKRVPPLYLRASYEQRLALLQGIMDTDGHCDLRGQLECGFSDEALANDLHELVSSLGIKATLRRKKTKSQSGPAKDHFRIKFVCDAPVFRLQRKVVRQKLTGFRDTTKRRFIKAVRRIDSVPMKCISVGSADGLYLVSRSMIPTHNSQLLLGWAVNEAQVSIIFRRELSQADGLERDGKSIVGSLARFNGTDLEWTWTNGKTIKLGGMKDADSWIDHAGRERDFIGFDEAGEFLEMQVSSMSAWLRAEEGKRTRMILASNPPRTSDGLWMIEWFAPWIDETHPLYPTQPGELRWVVYVGTKSGGRSIWVDAPGEYDIDGETYTAISRTFIPASLEDNPYRNNAQYRARLQNLQEPLRSQLLKGSFSAGLQDSANQTVPTAWVRAAQARWKDHHPEGIPMCAIGVDAAAGGDDQMVMAPRYDGWFAKLVKVPGKDIPIDRQGTFSAGLVLAQRRDNATVIVDMGGGYGGALYGHLTENNIECMAYKGANATTKRTADGKTGFTNTRSAAYWGFREALDPDQPGGSPIALPPDPRLLAGLCAPTYEVTSRGIKVEAKSKREGGEKGVVERLGYSPDEADAVVMAWWSGPRHATHASEWIDHQMQNYGKGLRGMQPKVIMAYKSRRR